MLPIYNIDILNPSLCSPIPIFAIADVRCRVVFVPTKVFCTKSSTFIDRNEFINTM